MKLLLLHLSDIHFENHTDYSKENLEAIINSLQSLDDFTAVLIIVSGDIAFSGLKKQYNVAWRFFRGLRDGIREKYDIGDVQFAIVPGNHDVDYQKGNLSHKEIKSIIDSNEQDLRLGDEANKQNCFYNHANGLKCFGIKGEFVCIKKIIYPDCEIKLNLINTAAYSSLEEDQGLHYLPERDLKRLDEEQKCDFVFTIMHHPHHWFCYKMKKELEKRLYEESDIVFVGHEHYSSSMDVEMQNARVRIYAGGELSDRGNWSNSEYYAGILDTETREYNVSSFIWNIQKKIYVKKEFEKTVLNKNRINKYGLSPKKNYIEELFYDRKYMISNDFSDYYVFPRLEEEVLNDKRIGREPSNIEELINDIFNEKHIIVRGRSDSGKTVLLKQLFKKLIATKCVIYLNAAHIKKYDYDKIIRNAFEETYSDDTVKCQYFRQIIAEDKVLLIDDADNVDDSLFEYFLEKAEKEFSTVVYTCKRDVELDIKERIRKGVLIEKYTVYRMHSFYSDKRRMLVSKIVKLLVQKDKEAQENIINILCDALSKQRNLFRMDPDFIVQFTKYYCNNIGETIQNDGEIFSKVFEANIVSLLKTHAKKMSVDKILIILDKIAYKMHIEKKYPMNQMDVYKVIDEYNDDFDSEVDCVDFLNILLQAGIMKKENTCYRFSEYNYLAYFVAREIKRRCIEEQDYSEFKKVLDYSCYGINADILLFVTYITDNLKIIRMLMDKAAECTDEWQEFHLDPVNIPYLSDMKQLEVNQVEDGDKEQSEKQEVEQEKQEITEKDYCTQEIYYYQEEELSLARKMVRALSILIILARTLPSFEHMMKRQDKEKCVKLLYSMPLKIFNIWAVEVESSKRELIEEIKQFSEWDYRKEKCPLQDSDVLNYLRWESISLLLEIMNCSMGNATKINTYKFLDTFTYKDKAAYQIEHLMSLDKRDSVQEFIKEAEEIFESQKQQLPQLLVKRVARHFILTSKKIKRGGIQRLNAKLWTGNLNQVALLIKKEKNMKEEQ